MPNKKDHKDWVALQAKRQWEGELSQYNFCDKPFLKTDFLHFSVYIFAGYIAKQNIWDGKQ